MAQACNRYDWGLSSGPDHELLLRNGGHISSVTRRFRARKPYVYRGKRFLFSQLPQQRRADHAVLLAESAIWQKSICYDGLTRQRGVGCLKLWSISYEERAFVRLGRDCHRIPDV